MDRRDFLHATSDREDWARLLQRIATPVLTHLARGTLRRAMPREHGTGYSAHPDATYLEALGRTCAGVAPWLALPDDATEEGVARHGLRERALQALVNAVDPANPDRINFHAGSQPIVDSAFLAHGFLRAPQALWAPLDATTKQRFVSAFISLRDRKPAYNKWLMYAAMPEAFLRSIDTAWDPMRVDYALNTFEEWYAGDGWYRSGPEFSFDYFNSLILHPMMVDMLEVHARFDVGFKPRHQRALKRMQRYGTELERMISPEGTFPPIGSSIVYRSGAFQALAQLALMERLPEGISGAQVRSALTAIHRRIYKHPGTFDTNGWLTLGFVGHQSGVAEEYLSTGSLYMATLSFLPLGLPARHAFWTSPAEDWTAKKAWAGEPFRKDYHVDY